MPKQWKDGKFKEMVFIFGWGVETPSLDTVLDLK